MTTFSSEYITRKDSVIFLCENAVKFRDQLPPKRRRLRLEEASPLLSGISTDHIIPVADLFATDMTVIGRRALKGMSHEYGISENTLSSTDCSVIVAHERFGSGSSREQAVWAITNAGFSLVLAKSFGPVFLRNATNCGLLTSTDLSLADMIQDGLPIPFEKFLEGKDWLSQQILKAGGLFNYLRNVKENIQVAPSVTGEMNNTRPMNILEKRLAKAAKITSIKSGESLLFDVNMAYTYEVLSVPAMKLIEQNYGSLHRTLAANKIFWFEDHFAQTTTIKEIDEFVALQRQYAQLLGCPEINYHKGRKLEGGGMGICHRVMLNKINPLQDQIVIATDSHTPTISALPIIGIPVGSTEFAAVIAEGTLPVTTPSVIRIELSGKLPPGTTIRDVINYLAGQVKHSESELYIEYGGSGFKDLSMDEVVSMCNLVPEAFNAKGAVTESFAAGIQFLNRKYGISETEAEDLYMKPDENAVYAQVIRFNMDETIPHIAMPGNPNDTRPITEFTSRVRIDKAHLISCTLGLDDLIQAAAVLKGHKVAPHVKLFVTPSSHHIREEAEQIGVTYILQEAGAIISDEIACGACIGHGFGAVEDGEVAISASNRNFRGRMGSKNAEVYLGSPIITALAAKLGYIPTEEEYNLVKKAIHDRLRKLVKTKRPIR